MIFARFHHHSDDDAADHHPPIAPTLVSALAPRAGRPRSADDEAY